MQSTRQAVAALRMIVRASSELSVAAAVAMALTQAAGAASPETPESRAGHDIVRLAQNDAPRTVPFNIEPQPLGEALTKLGEQSGLTIIVETKFSKGIKAAALSGHYTPDEALKKLLEPAGLKAEYLDSKTVAVRLASENDSHTTRAGRENSFLRLARNSLTSQTDTTSDSRREAGTEEPSSSSPPKAQRSSTLEEVVVTAQKRAQNLQDVPISISAIGGGRIEELGLRNLSDLMGQVPGVSFTAVGPGSGTLVIRGVASTDDPGNSPNRSETVGVYINDTPVGLPRYTPDISPFDLERVEVLRGPQGTLYGSGSLAGTVRYITHKPDTHEYQAKLGVDVSTTERGGFNHRVDGMGNIPLTDTLALRAVGYEVFDDGYIRGVGPANSGRAANNVRQYGGRADLRWQVTPDFTADANVMIQRMRSDLTPQDNIGYPYSRGVPIGPYEQYAYSPTYQNTYFNLYNLTLEYALGWGKLTSSTSYLRDDVNNSSDLNGVDQQFYGVDTQAKSFVFNHRTDLSEEFRLATELEGPLNFTGGVFYTHSDRKQFESDIAPGLDAAYTIPVLGFDSTALGASVDETYRQTAKIGERQTALFGELTYAVTSKLSATAGLRWFDVNQDYSISAVGLSALGNPPLDRVYAEHGFNPKFLVSYKVSEDALLSAQASRGFRLGGTNGLVPLTSCANDLSALGLTKAPETFKSENVWNYELNAKTSWDERRVTVNGSLYYIDYKNIQIQTTNTCGFDFIYNAAAATSKGAELELTARPSRGLEVTLGGAYTDARLSADVPFLRGKAGDQLPLSAKFTANATARYDFPIRSTLRGFAQYNYRYTDRIIIGLGYQGKEATVPQPAPAYGLHNIRLGLEDGGWEASLYLNNALNKEVVTYNYIFFAEHLRSLGQPRTGGLSVSYKW